MEFLAVFKVFPQNSTRRSGLLRRSLTFQFLVVEILAVLVFQQLLIFLRNAFLSGLWSRSMLVEIFLLVVQVLVSFSRDRVQQLLVPSRSPTLEVLTVFSQDRFQRGLLDLNFSARLTLCVCAQISPSSTRSNTKIFLLTKCSAHKDKENKAEPSETGEIARSIIFVHLCTASCLYVCVCVCVVCVCVCLCLGLCLSFVLVCVGLSLAFVFSVVLLMIMMMLCLVLLPMMIIVLR